jgi:NlpC/P60 family putative phage cell wall peptidase
MSPVEAARGWLGTPYHHQASLRGVGCDCLGLLRGVWREVIGPEPEVMPPYSPDWDEAQGTEHMLRVCNRWLVPADGGTVVVFRMRPNMVAKHCGIATPDGTLIHSHTGHGVHEVALTPWWLRRVAGRFNFPEVV